MARKHEHDWKPDGTVMTGSCGCAKQYERCACGMERSTSIPCSGHK